MTRRERRRQVAAKERRIKELRAAGWSGREIATELGITVQRLYDFVSDSKHRPPVLSSSARLARDEDERRRLACLKIRVTGNQTTSSEKVLEELETLLLSSEFESSTIAGAIMQVQVTKSLRRPRPGRGIPALLDKLRAAMLAADQVSLLRHRERTGERVKWQVWSFAFANSK